VEDSAVELPTHRHSISWWGRPEISRRRGWRLGPCGR